ncbi:MAG: hypothetical protein ACLR77_07695 [Oscillospiraceae bacterium]
MSSLPQHGRSRATARPCAATAATVCAAATRCSPSGARSGPSSARKKKLMQFAQTGFPADFPFSDHTGITDRPTRFADDLTQAELVRGYTVRPTDIDFGRHMNNVAYVRVLLDCFSAAELASGRIASMEVHYAAPCLEGEELGVYCRREESGCRLAIKKADGKAAVLAAVKLR